MLKKGQVIEAEHEGYYVYVGKIVRVENGKVILYDSRNPAGYRHDVRDIAEVERWLEQGRNGCNYRIRPQPSIDYEQPEITLSP